MLKPFSLALASTFLLTLVAGVLTENATFDVVLDTEYVEEVEQVIEAIVEGVENSTQITTVLNVSDVEIFINKTPPDEQELYPVVRVIDGDTIVISKDGVNESVRMIGVDTPETVHPSKPVQCFGEDASLKTKEWLEGRMVNLVLDEEEGERDKYYRLLGYVYRDDGFFINLELIKQGYAYEYTYNLPYQHQAEFVEAEIEAKGAGRGLWDETICL